MMNWEAGIAYTLLGARMLLRIAKGWKIEDKERDEEYFKRSLVDAIDYPCDIEIAMRAGVEGLHLLDQAHMLKTCRHIYPLRCSEYSSLHWSSFMSCFHYPIVNCEE